NPTRPSATSRSLPSIRRPPARQPPNPRPRSKCRTMLPLLRRADVPGRRRPRRPAPMEIPKMLWKPWTLAALAVLSALPAAASSVEVQLKLPQRARLDLKGRKSIALAPFQVETKEQAERFQGRDIDVQKEFERYLVKVLRRETELKVIETGGVDFPTTDFDQLAKQTDFWQALGERTGAD